ncbi:MAG: 3'-5' exonuclease [Betaproteobacteria bacterium]|nr:3'-5' exonuclease [Betaproteobacteria bacterium]
MSLNWRRWLGRSATQAPDLLRARWVVVDVESSGLDVRRDRLLAIGAVGVTGGCLAPRDSFEAVLRQDEASRPDNILVHRITGTEQRTGQDAGPALDAFLDFAQQAGTAGFVGFHAAFDEAMIRRTLQAQHRAWPSRLPFLDLAELAPALLPGLLPAKAPLDDWLRHFRIVIARRHHAVADALGTAQLFLHLRALALRQGLQTPGALFAQAHAQRWLARGG